MRNARTHTGTKKELYGMDKYYQPSDAVLIYQPVLVKRGSGSVIAAWVRENEQWHFRRLTTDEWEKIKQLEKKTNAE